MKRKFKLIPVLLIAALIYCGCEKKDEHEQVPPQIPPSPDFTWEITDHITRTVKFTNTSTNANSYSWNFGDAGTSTAVSPQHNYPSYGNYNVKLTASGEGGMNTATKTIAITP